MSFPFIPTVYPPDGYLLDGDDCGCNCENTQEAGLPRRIRLTISNGRLYVTIDESSDSVELAELLGNVSHDDLEGLVPALPLGEKHYHLTKAQYDKLNALANTVALRGWTAIMETLEEDGKSLVRFKQWIGGDGNPPPNPVPSYWGADGWTDKATATNFRGDKGDKGDKGDQGDRGEQGIQGQGGNNGWTPLYQHEEVLGKYTLRFYQWANGSGNVPALPSLPYLGANGAFVSAQDATDFRGVPGEQGLQGPRGRGYQIDKKGATLDERAQYDTQPEDFTWMDLSTGMVYFKISDSPGDWSEPYPFLGFKGWSPLLANVYEGERVVQRVIGWTGGQGDPPNYTYYISAGGPVETPDLAVDIRGPQGLQGDKGDPGDQGQQGIQGQQGQAGADGLSSYTYWGYCTNPEAADPGFSYLPGSTRPYIASITTTQTFNPVQLNFNQFANWVQYHGQTGRDGMGTLAPVQTIAELAALDTNDALKYPNNWIITVGEANALFRYDRNATGEDDGSTIIAPAAGPGRFIKTTGGDGGASDFTPLDNDNVSGFWAGLINATKVEFVAAFDRVAQQVKLLFPKGDGTSFWANDGSFKPVPASLTLATTVEEEDGTISTKASSPGGRTSWWAKVLDGTIASYFSQKLSGLKLELGNAAAVGAIRVIEALGSLSDVSIKLKVRGAGKVMLEGASYIVSGNRLLVLNTAGEIVAQYEIADKDVAYPATLTSAGVPGQQAWNGTTAALCVGPNTWVEFIPKSANLNFVDLYTAYPPTLASAGLQGQQSYGNGFMAECVNDNVWTKQRTLIDTSIRTITAAAYPALLDDYILLVDATAGPVTITLPTAAGNKNLDFIVKKIDSSANAVTIDPSGAETLDGSATRAITAQWNSMRVVSSGTNYFII